MAISEFEIKRIEKLVDQYIESKRPPAHIRDQVDLSFRIINQGFEIFEVRPNWRDPSSKTERFIAKAKYVKKRKEWNIYYMKSDMKWHSYEPFPTTNSLEEVIKVIEHDSSGCFWG